MGSEVEVLEVDVAIVGAGMGGFALAVSLQERGIQAHIFEQTAEIRPHFGTGMGVGVNGMLALDGIKQGLGQRFEQSAGLMKKSTNIFRPEGEMEKVVVKLPIHTETHRSILIPWRDAHEILRDEFSLYPNLVHWKHTFVDYRIVPEGRVEARLSVEEDEDVGSSRVKVVRAKLLVGADGVRSQVRKLMVGDEPRDLYMITWNTVVPTESIRSLNLHEENETRFIFYTSSRKSTACGDCGLGRSLVQARVADKSGEITNSLTSDLEVNGRNARKLRVLKQIEGIEGLQNLRIAFESIEPGQIREGRSFDRLPLRRWSDSSRQIVLIGDAAHAMYPGPGMGGRMAFEDAHQLSILLSEALSSGPTHKTTIPDAIMRFEEVRFQRVTRIQSYAAELTGWPEHIPDWVQKLSPLEKRKRHEEFMSWTNKYPEAMAGDPDSMYWKP